MEIVVGTIKDAKSKIECIEALGLEVVSRGAGGTWIRSDQSGQERLLDGLRILRWGRNNIVATIDEEYGSERLRETVSSTITIGFSESATGPQKEAKAPDGPDEKE